ncbi:hypothetical protein CLAIMM_01965 [Cladophialophora immunda]|nr:hypothetical protein CLAIMM_01965 [Cladophialophora immunda]
MACYWIDNQDALRCFLNEIGGIGIGSDLPSLYIDAEGNLIVDVFTLKHAAFNISFRGISLRTLLESSSIQKIFFDVRNDADALFSLYNVLVEGVVDLQMMEYFQNGRSGRNLASLRKCVEQDSGLPSEDIQDWLEVKLSVPRSWLGNANLHGSPFQGRPLPADLLIYAAGGVEYLPALYKAYSLRLTAQGWLALRAETDKRLRRSRTPAYDPQASGKQRGKGPYRIVDLASNSNTKTKARVRYGGQGHRNETSAEPPKAHLQLTREEVDNISSAIVALQNQTSVPTERLDQVQEPEKALRHMPIAFVRAGEVKSRRKGKKQSSSNSWGGIGYHDAFPNDLDWALCDKDCGWCGHCYSGY